MPAAPDRAAVVGFLLLTVALMTLGGQVSPAIAIIGARTITTPDAAPIMDGTVVTEGDRIASVGPRADVRVPNGATILDGAGLIVTAGFQNSHVHFTEDHWANANRQPAADLTTALERMLTRYGFTTVVDTASLLENTLALRRRIDAGEVAGPRILTAGLALYPPNGVPYYVREVLPPAVVTFLPQPETPAAAVAVVRGQVQKGADITKIFAGSWIERGKVLPMPVDVATAAVTEAHAHGKPGFAHPSNVAGLEVALRSGVDVLAHAIDDTRGFTASHLQWMRRQNVAIVPTFMLFGDDRFFWEVSDIVRNYARGGGEILFGTDVGYHKRYDPRREYELMATAGFSWREILAALTTAPASRFGEAMRRGRIAPGMEADLVVLGSDPAANTTAFADVRYVVRSGRIIYRPQ